MVSRFVVLVLALFMFCAGFAAQAQAAAFASADAAQVDASTDPDDDQPLNASPGQAQPESTLDPLALVMALPGTTMPALTMSRPAPHTPAHWLTPYLDGPQRPPCATPPVA